MELKQMLVTGTGAFTCDTHLVVYTYGSIAAGGGSSAERININLLARCRNAGRELWGRFDTSRELWGGLNTSWELGRSLDTSRELSRGFNTSRELSRRLDTSWELGWSLNASRKLGRRLNTSRELGWSLNASWKLSGDSRTGGLLIRGLRKSDGGK
ncbi:hypothetical protein DL89DRAFT_87865 [Linderina pennispora]|uniref:Uncharacterized protein n=1 Tax=Linderina pennispora TaxID=61395 RepID=A0A1Y1WID7_9FUNG|nr:uncharacterized protein DL89DRAFT_87865 [Linderina pennispora]ORX73088.1 hypothetical protein DL89DRAFT_87865 [Linderina pennispora]